uniref:Uncharacterized protein n=1 Tax=Arundo donax TaxID=35708 RepID=A0A0A9DIN3_ARUDO
MQLTRPEVSFGSMERLLKLCCFLFKQKVNTSSYC